MPSDTSVSIDEEKCRACLSAAWWNGHAAQIATGAASATRNHCQPGNRDQGNTDSTIDRSVSGTKNTSARISRGAAAGPRRHLRPTPRRPRPADQPGGVAGRLDHGDQV